MNIFGSDIANRNNLNRMGNQQNLQTARTGQAEGVHNADRVSTDANLQTGQTFEGEIIDITPKNVAIRMDNQQVVNARLGETMELSIGQKMVFEVKEQSGDQIVIHPKPDANMSGQNMAAVKALTANGLTVSDRNIQIASALMEAGMPLNKESMRKIMQQSMNYPDAGIKNLVSMNQLQIPVNSVNVTQYESYVNHEHQMTGAIDQVMDGFEEALVEIMENNDPDSVQDFAQELTRIFGWGDSDSSSNGMEMTKTAEMESVEPALIDNNETVTQEQITGDSKAVSTDASGNRVIGQETEEMKPLPETVSQMTDNSVPAEGKAAVNTDGKGIPESAQTISAMAAGEPAAEGNEMTAGHIRESVPDSSAVPSSIEEQTGSDRELIQSLKSQLTEAGVPESTVNQMVQSSKSYGDLAANITNYLADPNRYMIQEQETAPDKAAAKQILQSDGFRKLLKKAVRDEWMMKPEEMKTPKEIDELYKKILRQSSDLEQSLNSGGSGNKHFSESASNMRENIQFMQQLNEQFVYAQMPMNMSGTEANSELFVYANKKKLQQSTDGVKVLLHLDMPNLGSTDILVRLKDKKLHASFRMADQTSISVVADNMDELQDKLEAKGFIFTNEVVKQEPPKDNAKSDDADAKGNPPDAVVDEMLNQDLVTGMKRFTFDIRG